jgi:hypothetical protein
MSKKRVPIENRLILSLAKRGGTASLTEIRLDFYGRLTTADLEHARQELTGLVVAEQTRSKGSRRPTTSLSLTLRGWAAVQFLRPGWKPQRLSVDVLKVWLADLQAEREPWAMSLLRDAEDARQWRQHEAERKAADRAREKKRAAREKPEPRYPSAGRNRSPEDLEARAAWLAEKTGRETPDESEPELFATERTIPGRQDSVPPPANPRPTYPPPIAGGFCPRCHGSLPLHCGGCPLAGRTDFTPERPPTPVFRTGGAPVPDDPTTPLIERIRKAGYQTRGDQVLYGGERYISAEEWMRLNPHIDL